ncbi:MAG: hypothetical protein JWP42_670 [Pseudomonas sp.]|nr:hypothetical protein [Pseudomonas sp.]
MKAKAVIRGIVVGLNFFSSGHAVSNSSPDNKAAGMLSVITFGPTLVATLDMTESVKSLKSWAFAKDDAAAFVATDGAIRGPFLESALEALRKDEELDGYSDVQLTHALLAG